MAKNSKTAKPKMTAQQRKDAAQQRKADKLAKFEAQEKAFKSVALAAYHSENSDAAVLAQIEAAGGIATKGIREEYKIGVVAARLISEGALATGTRSTVALKAARASYGKTGWKNPAVSGTKAEEANRIRVAIQNGKMRTELENKALKTEMNGKRLICICRTYFV